MNDEIVTTAQPKSWDDQRIEVIIGTLLRTGVILAAAVVLFGGALYLVRHGHEIANYSTFHGEPESLKSAKDIVHGVFGMSARAIIQLGLLLLIATPVARVAFSAVAFAIEHDYMYVVITLIVLAILSYSLFASS
ncbi:MAG: DUF1634 domain-containing protein [Candidatus Korobacteraceae bacterium]|jgi:uncharacterized membrane protein